jgi:hypothetical protein
MADEISGVPDEIAGEPGAMGTFTLVGPGVALYKFDGAAKLTAGMPEGQAYAVKDEAASRQLDTFVRSTANGFDAYHNRATAAKQDYLHSDEQAAGRMRSVGTITQQFVSGD